VLIFSQPHVHKGRFDEDGSWIGQYGTLRKKQQQISTESSTQPLGAATYV